MFSGGGGWNGEQAAKSAIALSPSLPEHAGGDTIPDILHAREPQGCRELPLAGQLAWGNGQCQRDHRMPPAPRGLVFSTAGVDYT